MGEVGGEEGSGGRRTRRGWFRSSSSPWAPLLSPWSRRRLARFWRGLQRGLIVVFAVVSASSSSVVFAVVSMILAASRPHLRRRLVDVVVVFAVVSPLSLSCCRRC